jgi:aspartyl protease family protein
VVGLFPGAAVLSVDGQRKLVRVGQTGPGGVQVVSVDSRGALLRVDGVERSYGLSREYNTEGFAAPQKQALSIARSNGGHYWAEGAINGRAQQFLVDTGATSIALNESHARRLGIDYRTSGQPIQVSTASGTAKGWRVTLDKVSVGPLQVLGVEAVVLEGGSPTEALLGMSFLNRVGWRVENNLLVLQSHL